MLSKSVATLLIAFTLLATPSAFAQGGAWHGQDNEFGSVRTPYGVEMDGQRVPIEAKIVLRKNYEEKDSRFFMFAWDVRNTPLDVTLESLIRTDTGDEMPCYDRQGSATDQVKCFVDLRDMPPEGTEILMRGTLGSSKSGSHQVGAVILPFTYRWEKVPMSNGLDSELYGHTTVNVQKATSGNSELGGIGNKVPAPGIFGILGALGAAVGIIALRRRRAT